MPKSIDSIGPKPNKKTVKPIVEHKAGDVVRPKGAAPEAGQLIKPKDYVEPNTRKTSAHVLSDQEYAASKKHTNAPRKKAARKWGVIAVLVLIVVIVSGYAVMAIQRQIAEQNRKKLVNTACTENNKDLLFQGVTAVNTQDRNDLSTVAVKVQQLDNYDIDQNCLALITWNAIISGEFVEAKNTVANITPIYDASKNNTSETVIYTSDPQKLLDRINEIEQRVIKTQQSQELFNQRIQP